MNNKILIVEDEEKISRFLELELSHEGYDVSKVFDGRSALELLEENTYDLVILDVMLPGLNGMEVLRRMRKSSQTPVIMLTAKDDTMDKVMGLDLGADDYMTKPFQIEELLARIRVCLKRELNTISNENILKFGPIILDKNQHCVLVNDSAVELTHKEFLLLETLMANNEIVLSREKILNKVWGYDYYGDTNIVDVYIRYLRKKIDEKFNVKLIHTIRGAGYMFKNE